jgi:hypothetical protein
VREGPTDVAYFFGKDFEKFGYLQGKSPIPAPFILVGGRGNPLVSYNRHIYILRQAIGVMFCKKGVRWLFTFEG